MTQACNPSSIASARYIHLELRCGRLRRAHAIAVMLAGVAAGWLWLGNAGAGLLGLWMWSGHWRDWRGGTRSLRIGLDDLRYLRLSAHRVMGVARGWQTWQVFSDELAAAEYARLRRRLKANLEGKPKAVG